MRARTVNEEQKFERGKNPKEALGVGGLDLYNDVVQRVEDLDYEIGQVKFGLDEKYQEDLEKMLVGRTITAYMEKLMTINPKTGKTVSKSGRGDYTVKIADVKPNDKLSEWHERYKMAGFSPKIMIAGEDGNIYTLQIAQNKKIHFDEG